jgi:hypothetical protein
MKGGWNGGGVCPGLGGAPPRGSRIGNGVGGPTGCGRGGGMTIGCLKGVGVGGHVAEVNGNRVPSPAPRCG